MAKQKQETQNAPVKTGYEGTGATDTFQQVGDDIDLKLPGQQENVKDEEEEKKNEPSGEKQQDAPVDETAPNNDEELTFLNDKKPEAEKKEESKEDEKPPEISAEEKDIFDIESLEKDLAAEQQQKQEAAKMDWKGMAKKEFAIDLEDNSQEKFFSALKTKIEESSKKIVPDTSKYPEDARMIIEHLESGGSFEEIINPLGQLDNYILQTDPDDILKDYLTVYEEMKEEDAEAKIEELHDEEKFDDKLKEVKKLLFTHRAQKAEQLIKAANEKMQRNVREAETRIKGEREQMIEVVNSTEEFMGMKLPDKVKEYIKSEISNGVLSQRNNNARTQVYARLFEIFGKQIIDQYTKKIGETARTSFNKAKEQELSKQHNIPPRQNAENVQEHRAQETQNPLSAFLNIEKDAIEVD